MRAIAPRRGQLALIDALHSRAGANSSEGIGATRYTGPPLSQRGFLRAIGSPGGATASVG